MKQLLLVLALITLLFVITAAMYKDATSIRNHYTGKVSDYAGVGYYRSYLEANGFSMYEHTRVGNITTYVYLHKCNLLFDVTITVEDEYDSLLGVRLPLSGRALGEVHIFSYNQ